MTREWKAGDVAMVNDPVHGEIVGIYMLGGRPCWHGHAGGMFRWLDANKTDARPLVVLDPEDREQIDLLTKTLVERMNRDGDKRSAALGIHPGTVTAALRSLVADPKPEEPLGLGAVVELADGRQAVRTWQPVEPWSHFKDGLPFLDSYGEIDVVRVLSEGVPHD